MTTTNLTWGLMLAFIALITGSLARAADDSNSDEELAKKLSNPIAAMISIPFQFNYDQDVGPLDEGHKTYVNFQPVVPIKLNADWNMIARVILPVVDQTDIFPGSGNQTGLGDTTASLFFSPVKPTDGGVIWGLGPVFYIPTATDDLLGAKKWGLGPTAVLLKQTDGFTYGALVNHIWSVGTVRGNNADRSSINSTYLQPFLTYTTKTAWTYGANLESTYNWDTNHWAVPLNLSIGKLVRFGTTPVSFTAGTGYWVESDENGAKGWRFRLVATILIPRG
jgi:hypothetical protein